MSLATSLQLALEHVENGQFDIARAEYENLNQFQPVNAFEYHLKALLAYRLNHSADALALVQKAIDLDSTSAGFYRLLGDLFYDENDLASTIAAYRSALKLSPDDAEILNNLGNALVRNGEHPEAIKCFRSALQNQPNYPAAAYNLGVACQAIADWAEAAKSYSLALTFQRDFVAAKNNLAVVLQNSGEFDRGIALLKEAVDAHPSSIDLHNTLGMAQYRLGAFDDAINTFQHAVGLAPERVEPLNNLADALRRVGRIEEAVAAFRQALRIAPQSPIVANNLGNVLKETGRLEEAIACYDHALNLNSDYPEAWNNLGNAFKDSGRLDQALASFEKALQLKPHYAIADSARCYTLHFHPKSTAESIYQEHRNWESRHAKDLSQYSHKKSLERKKPLRIGYVSPDLRDHVVGRFMLPILEGHDHSAFEIFCYSDAERRDALADRLRAASHHWHDTFAMSDEALAELIFADHIDILVDLTMHMGSNRMLTFARKPAPIQITYLAYCSTTGLSTMDFRITDPFLDPPNNPQMVYCEKTIWLPQSYWCYRPPEQIPVVNELPAIAVGHVTFGCLNNFCKINSEVIACWARLLSGVPRSRLLLHASLGSHRDWVLEQFANTGIDSDRIEFIGFVPSTKYFEIYHRIDIALDPFPYAGGTTSCDALWMGVPIITLAGQTAVGRGGVSVLSNLDLSDWIAGSMDQYAEIGRSKASDPRSLQQLRSTMRNKMRVSPIMDEPGFTRALEGAYRTAWNSDQV